VCQLQNDLSSLLWKHVTLAFPINVALQELSKSIFRDKPESEKSIQGELFKPAPLVDMAGKDDISLMDLCPFGLEKKPRYDVIKYSLSDAEVTIQGGTESGMATVYDYDIILYIAAHLTNEMNKVKAAVERGENPDLPSRLWQPDMRDMLAYLRRKDGGRTRVDLEASLDRLQRTSVKIKEKPGKDSFRRTASFNLLGGYYAAQRNNKKELVVVKISIDPWMYDGIVRVKKPSVVSINKDYFLLKDGIHRALARMARKAAGNSGEVIIYSVEKIHHQFGSKQELKKFTYNLKKKIANLEKHPIPDYEIKYFSKGRGKNFVSFRYTGKQIKELSSNLENIQLKPETYEKARLVAPSYDVYYLECEWRAWAAKKGGKIDKPDSAFIGFCAKFYTNNSYP